MSSVWCVLFPNAFVCVLCSLTSNQTDSLPSQSIVSIVALVWRVECKCVFSIISNGRVSIIPWVEMFTVFRWEFVNRFRNEPFEVAGSYLSNRLSSYVIYELFKVE